MRIARVHIHNFCSIKDLEIGFQPFSVLIGPNNHGKSNVLRAIEFALNPTQKLPSHFRFCNCDVQNDGDVWVEITFDQLSEAERVLLAEYVIDIERVVFRKTVQFVDGLPQAPVCNAYTEEFSEWYLQPGGHERLSSGDKVAAELGACTDEDLRTFLSDGKRKVRAEYDAFRRQYIQSHRHELKGEINLSSSSLPTTKGGLLSSLPELYFVPAVKDAVDELKTKGATPFAHLIQGAMKDLTPQFGKFQGRLDDLFESINRGESEEERLAHPLAKIETALRGALGDWDVSPKIQIKTPDLAELIGQNVQLLLGDGVETSVESKGHGLQRAMIIALLQVWASFLSQPQEVEGEKNEGATSTEAFRRSIIFLVEEPELYLHPQAQRRLVVSLWQLAEQSGHQVITCSHSPSFISLDKYRSISIISKDSATSGTCARQCNADIFASDSHGERKAAFSLAYWINPHRAELFFARQVVLVEGPTEGVLLPFLAKRLGFLIEDVCLIDCGGKGNIETYMRLLNAFLIPYVVIHDEDPLPDPLPEDEQKRRSAQRIFAMNDSIKGAVDSHCGRVHMLSPTLEDASGVSKTQGDKIGKPLAAINHFSTGPEIPEQLRQAVELAYGPTVTGLQSIAQAPPQTKRIEASVIRIEAPDIADATPVTTVRTPVIGT